LNNWDTPIWVRVIVYPTLHLHLPDYHIYDDETKTYVDQTLDALKDHIANVPMEAEFTYRVGRIYYKVKTS